MLGDQNVKMVVLHRSHESREAITTVWIFISFEISSIKMNS